MSKLKKIHMIGIKGSGMSALACILHDNGYEVTGSDIEETIFTERSVRERKIPIFPFSKDNIHSDVCVIAGNAFSDEHPEVKEAKEKATMFFRYHDFIGQKWMADKVSVAISGAHGKTSTTGLMSTVFQDWLPTSYLIGDGTGKGVQETSHFVFEACEYRRHFLAYKPDYGVITNIDFDHPDYFSSLEDVKHAFQTFADGVKKALIVCGDDTNTHELTAHVPIYRYGIEEGNDIQAKEVIVKDGQTHFSLWKTGEKIGNIILPLVGRHHVQNALSVITVSLLEGLQIEQIQASLSKHQGTQRRFQTIYEKEYLVIDDYAHHPTEIRATLETARLSYPEKKIVAIFQPHTFTRTKTFLQEFADSLSEADQVYLCPIFGSAREARGELSITDLQEKVKDSKILKEQNVTQLLEEKDAVLLFMGAGDIQKYETHFLSNLSQ